MAQDRVHQDCQDTSVKSCCCCATQCFKWLLGLMSLVWIALSIAEIVIGSVYLQQCPAQRFIPIYLIVNGVTVIVMSLLSIVAGLRPNKLVYGILTLLSLFWFAWLITGLSVTLQHCHHYGLFLEKVNHIRWPPKASERKPFRHSRESKPSQCPDCSASTNR
ncbi:uncharacterized protein LOC144783233 [Lissotriton helveticus]